MQTLGLNILHINGVSLFLGRLENRSRFYNLLHRI
jgi:hypothetical protein